ncbi:hypothetical protein [Massilia luteola]|uniref:hypothetical protein n=1 Tax=Massilia luteola TaxID=3081751 RepID=UPI002ACC220E|nr:hypothetical protein [Massilia sp. Gc5]
MAISFTQRLREPSTWAGLAVIGMMFGLDPTKVQAVAAIANAIVPFVHTDGGALAQAIIGLTTIGAAGAAVAMPEKPAAAAPVVQAAPAPVAAPVAQQTTGQQP